MAKQKKRSSIVDNDDTDKLMAEVATDLPDDMDELLIIARTAVKSHHDAVFAGEWDALVQAANQYEAIIWKMNGGTHFGCKESPDAPGCVVERHCAATPGTMPMWGQAGEFLIELNGIRALVKFEGSMGYRIDHFAFHTIDLDRLFISETGYRSYFFHTRDSGRLVGEVAESIFAELLTERKPVAIDDWHRDWLFSHALPDWVMKLQPKPRREPETVPDGCERVEVYLPPHQAFIARRWAEDCIQGLCQDTLLE